MPHEPESKFTNIISNRIGPIADKFASVVSQEDLRAILVIQLNAQAAALKEEIKAIEEVVKVVKGKK